MLNIKKWSTTWGGRELTIEVGRFALQATQACTVRYGDTVIMATVVQSETIREGLDYFPLMVSFEEKLSAAGKIKGSRFMKREGRPSDESILAGRLIDRAIRPLFDDSLRFDIQILLTPLSIDGENDASITAMVAASAVLALSPIPWAGPIAGARIGRKNGEFVLNITAPEINGDTPSDFDVVVAGTPDKLVMVEAAGTEVSEEVMLEAMQWGCAALKPVIDLITQAQKELGVVKYELAVPLEVPPSVQAGKAVEAFVASVADTMIFNSAKVSRKERNDMIAEIKKAAKQDLIDKGFDEAVYAGALGQIKLFVSQEISKRILEKGERLDKRGLEEIRELIVDIDLLPRVHGSAMFMRGDTQVLSTVTLGAPGDKQTLDTMEEEGEKRYMHHYNDAPFTYGEAGPMRGPSRRAIGHGALAERALLPVLPLESSFPYTMRVVSEVLGSNGSSSMASTCASTLALMAAGVPITKPVAGIAMGLATNEQTGAWKVLTDLQDVEDGPGGMDFKITGTRTGVTAIQMDTKTKGLSWDIVKQTLAQARKARGVILDTMQALIAEPRAELSPYAPRITTITIDPEKIGEVIGPGGKTIKKIIEETGVDIDIEQDGRVLITAVDGKAMARAVELVEQIVKEVKADEVYEGKVVRLEDFGAFVNILPNKDGLVHVSEVAWARTNKPSDVLKIGDTVTVKVKEIDNLGRVNLSIKALLPRPEGFVDEPPRPPRSFDNRGGDHRGGDRGGRPQRKPFFKRDN
ncbi:MAG: polyribonucleotide nucleotidyltransferase [Candidatus Magasanikbacteria bacterium]|nr:polyribonucleotide nucleotidyltransferase [Candidatus Magasanikbacteria bacterium]